MLPAMLALFAAYAAAVTWQMRRAMKAAEPARRRREAVRLLLLVSLGAPLAAVLILVAL
ncbi:MAG: hypothetical protein V3R95_01255 [Dehalococcoidia bacterium]